MNNYFVIDRTGTVYNINALWVECDKEDTSITFAVLDAGGVTKKVAQFTKANIIGFFMGEYVSVDGMDGCSTSSNQTL